MTLRASEERLPRETLGDQRWRKLLSDVRRAERRREGKRGSPSSQQGRQKAGEKEKSVVARRVHPLAASRERDGQGILRIAHPLATLRWQCATMRASESHRASQRSQPGRHRDRSAGVGVTRSPPKADAGVEGVVAGHARAGGNGADPARGGRPLRVRGHQHYTRASPTLRSSPLDLPAFLARRTSE